jgi:HAD superfamily hydrolase (TIGR01484 family)
MELPRALTFDLDNTLAPAFEHLSARTASGLGKLLALIPVAITSGATIERMEEYILPALPKETNLGNLYLFPDTSARCYVWSGTSWERAYNHVFTKEVFDAIVAALTEGIEKTGIVEGAPLWGERVLARDAQVTFAGLGVDAPGDKKRAWDPDRSKRTVLKKFLDERLAAFPLDIRVSSRTAIDITQSGVNKAEGVHWLAAHLGIEPKDMLFVGDDLAEGGNDAVVIPTGIETRQTSGPDETADIIEELLTTYGRSA